jgi:hypothetical protein
MGEISQVQIRVNFLGPALHVIGKHPVRIQKVRYHPLGITAVTLIEMTYIFLPDLATMKKSKYNI